MWRSRTRFAQGGGQQSFCRPAVLLDATQTTEIVQFLLNFAPRSQPLGLRSFAALGIDAQQVSELVQQGWLRRLSEDAYLLRGDRPSVDGTIAYLRAFIPNLHVGGRTALEWHRMTHHLRFRERTDLWGRGYCSIPSWAVDRLSCSYYSHSLFDTGMDEGHMAETFAGTKTLEP